MTIAMVRVGVAANDRFSSVNSYRSRIGADSVH